MAFIQRTVTDYDSMAREAARDTVEEYNNEIVEQLREMGSATNDLYEYERGDEYHHENHVDKNYSLQESAELLDQLHKHTETDNGLWSGLDPIDAVECQAAYTFGNAVMHHWQWMVKQINEDAEKGILADMLGQDDPAPDEIIRQRVIEIAEECL